MFQVHLKEFEGPMDLLLFLIQREEIDILDIPIAHITDEYLAHLRLMELVDLNSVGDFLYIAALLIRIKLHTLFPNSEEGEAEEEAVDPRQELVERLLEYRRFKKAAEALGRKHAERLALFPRGKATEPIPGAVDEMLVGTGIYDLIGALRYALTSATEEPSLTIVTQDYAAEEQRSYVLQVVASRGAMAFSELVRMRSKPFIISTFLAILELVQRGELGLKTLNAPEDFMVMRSAAHE